MLPFARRISTASLIVLASITGACADANLTGVAVPKQPAHSVSIAAATAWTASGPGFVATDVDSASDVAVVYDYGPGDFNVHTWDFETTADQTATVTLPWSYIGEHPTFSGGSTVVLYAVVNDAVVATLVDQVLTFGSFTFSGTYTFTVSAGDTYGFRFGGSSNTDPEVREPELSGRLAVDLPEAPVEPVDPVTKDDCKDGGWMAYGFRNQGQCIAFVETGHDSR